MLKPLCLFFCVATLAIPAPAQSQASFSTDSAAAYLRTIAVDIGARPMGSPNERRAMDFALGKFREFGLSESYLMPISEYPGPMGGPPVNTRSGVAVGILRGATSRIIVIGAHLDSVNPSVPGANDDGSGAADVIELARVLSQRKNESTLVFALFGGEEAGLQGSRYFVDHFPDIDSVSLMLQIDMANGSKLLFPTIDAEGRSSPEWLVRASYEEFSRLGLSGLHFPTDFFVFMGALPGGGVGSDHEPFLEKDIPAIDFTSDARDPIHTPQDNFENFKISGLKRTGELIYALVERFDAGVPAEKSGNYLLYQIGSYPLFVPRWALRGLTLISLMVAIVTLLLVRRRDQADEGPARAKIPGLKLFLLMVIIQTCVWLSENVVSLIKGVRYPWMTDLNGYFLLAFFAACIGIWISLQISPRLRLRHNAYPYFLRASLLLTIFIALGALSSSKLALYPAIGLLLLSLAMLVKQPVFKFLLWILAPHFMFRLFFSEGFDFLARYIHTQPEITRPINAVLIAVYVLFFSIWAFPFLLGFAAVYFDSNVDLLFLRRLRRRTAGVVSLAFFIITVIVLSREDSYSKEWMPSIRIQESFNVDSSKGSLIARSSEFLAGARLSFTGKDTTFRGSATEARFEDALPAPSEPWVSARRTVQVSRQDSMLHVDLTLHIDTKYRPYTFKVTYSSNNGKLIDATSPYASSTTSRTMSLQWSAFPDSSLTIPISFSIAASDSLAIEELLEARFIEMPQPVSVEAERASNVIRRSDFVKVTSFKLE